MSAARTAIESLYKGKCTITEFQATTDAVSKITSQGEVDVLKDQPCKLAFKTITSTKPNDGSAALVQAAKLFIAPEVVVKPGSKITVTQDGVTTAYKNSGKPAIYASHQEIMLDLFDGWS